MSLLGTGDFQSRIILTCLQITLATPRFVYCHYHHVIDCQVRKSITITHSKLQNHESNQEEVETVESESEGTPSEYQSTIHESEGEDPLPIKQAKMVEEVVIPVDAARRTPRRDEPVSPRKEV